MPMYEFYCTPCNTVFTFFSKTVNVTKKPACPKCSKDLERQVSMFSFSQKKRGTEALPFNSQQSEEGVKKLKGELDRLKDKDPRDAERFKKKFERWAGVNLDYTVRAGANTAEEELKKEELQEQNEPLRDDTIYEL